MVTRATRHPARGCIGGRSQRRRLRVTGKAPRALCPRGTRSATGSRGTGVDMTAIFAGIRRAALTLSTAAPRPTYAKHLNGKSHPHVYAIQVGDDLVIMS